LGYLDTEQWGKAGTRLPDGENHRISLWLMINKMPGKEDKK